MVRLSVYILIQIIKWLIISIATAMLLFLGSQLLRIAPFIIGSKPNPLELLSSVGLLLIPVLSWALTPAFSIAVFAVAGKMAADGEFIAADASGISRKTLALAPLALAFVLGLFSALLWLKAAPESQQLLRATSVQLVGRGLVGSLAAKRFIKPTPTLSFFANKKKNHQFEGVFIENREKTQRTIIFAKEGTIEIDTNRLMLKLLLTQGQVFTFPGGQSLPAAIHFQSTQLAFPLGDEIEKRLVFLPQSMSYTTERLLGNKPNDTSWVKWRFALWRRIAGPVGFLAMSLVSILLAFTVSWRHRIKSIGVAAGVFLAYHIFCRIFEVLMEAGYVLPFGAAIGPSLIVVFFGIIYWLSKTGKKSIK